MRKRSLHSMATQLNKATNAALQSNTQLAKLATEVASELAFRSSVAGTLEEYRQELAAGTAQHSLKDVLDHVEAFFVSLAMQQVDGNIAHAAELLQIPEATLRYKLGKHGLR